MVLTLHPTLAPIGYRVEWAKKHISQLEREVEAFFASEPYEIATKPDPQVPNCVRYYVASIREGHPINIPLIAGDALFNLRAALDHLVYKLALANGTTDEKILRGTSFPIFDSADLYREHAHKKMQGMSQDAINAIDATEPFKGGNDLLWQLHRLNNIDKHRLLVTVGSPLRWHNLPQLLRPSVHENIIKEEEWAIVVSERHVEINARPALRKCPLEVGDEIDLAFAPILETDAPIKLTFEVAFCEPGIAESQPVIDTLKEMANVIDGIIIEFKSLLP